MNLSSTLATAAVMGASLFSATPAFLTNSNASTAHHTHASVSATSRPKVHLASKEAPAPAPQPKVITVQPGDNLTKLAEANNSTSLRMFYANTNVSDPDLVYPNEQLRVPTPDENLTPREVPANQPVVTPAASEPAQAPAPAAAPRVAAPAPVSHAVSSAPAVAGGSVWDRLAACESSGNWAINTGNGFYGGLQFTLSSWQAVGGSGLPNQASREEQIMRGQMLQARGGWGNWPACSAKLGLR
jgi:LysM repeat protein